MPMQRLTPEQQMKIDATITKHIKQRGGNDDSIQQGLWAIARMLQRKAVNAAVLQLGLAPVLPGTMQIAADALRVSIPDLNRMVVLEEIDSATFLIKFTAELQAQEG